MREAKENEAGEKGDIGRGHFLSGYDDAAVYVGNFPLLVLIHVHAATAGVIPKALQELPFLQIYAILELVQMHEGVGTLGHSVRQGRYRGVG